MSVSKQTVDGGQDGQKQRRVRADAVFSCRRSLGVLLAVFAGFAPVVSASEMGDSPVAAFDTDLADLCVAARSPGGTDLFPDHNLVTTGTETIGPLPFLRTIEYVGTPGNDLVLVEHPDAAFAFDFRSVDAGAGDDIVCGGDGPDYVSGGDGHDQLYGGAGDDILDDARDFVALGGDETDDGLVDYLDGGEGDDVLYGGGGADLLRGGPDDDDLWAGEGNDTLVGGEGDDTLAGDAGNDLIFGGLGADTLHGGDGTADVCVDIEQTVATDPGSFIGCETTAP